MPNLRRFAALGFLALLIGGLYFIDSANSGSFLGQTLEGSRNALASISSIFKSKPSVVLGPEVPLYKPLADYEDAVIKAVERISPAVVAITISKNVPVLENCVPSEFGGIPAGLQQLFGFPGYGICSNGTRLEDVGGGSGFIISKDGLIVTNKHVVSDEDASYTVFTNDGKKYSARVLGLDPIQDLAIIKIDGSNFPVVTLGNSDDIKLGQTAIAIGNALGEFRNTVSTGVISGLGRSITAIGNNTSETIQGVIQTDAAINPGNSGGPLINLRGEVIGVSVATAQNAQSISFALPINWAKQDIETVLSGGEIKTPYLGVRYVMLTPDIAEREELEVSYGAYISADRSGEAVVKDSPAAKAGLKAGDIILSVNGESLEDKELSRFVQGKKVGDVLRFDVFRDKRTISVEVRLGEKE